MSADQAAALGEALLHLHEAKAEPANGSVEVTASRDVLREAALVALDSAAERLSARCTALLRGEGTVAEVGAQLDSVRRLLDLLRAAGGGVS